MLKIDYKNPMTKVFQYEYALYMLTADLFARVVCRSSVTVERVGLYYAELSKMSKKEERISYEKQYELEQEMQSLIQRDVIGKVAFPGMHMCHAELTIRTREDGSHIFVYSDGVYGFELTLKWDQKNRCVGIAVRNHSSVKAESEDDCAVVKSVSGDAERKCGSAPTPVSKERLAS